MGQPEVDGPDVFLFQGPFGADHFASIPRRLGFQSW